MKLAYLTPDGIRTAIANGLDGVASLAGTGATKLGQGVASTGTRIREAFSDETLTSTKEAQWRRGSAIATVVPLAGSLFLYFLGAVGRFQGKISPNEAVRAHTAATASLLVFATLQSVLGDSDVATGCACAASMLAASPVVVRESINLRTAAKAAKAAAAKED